MPTQGHHETLTEQGLGYSLIHIFLPLSIPKRWWSLLSGTPGSIAGHTNVAASQTTQVDENGGGVDLKVHDHDETENQTHDFT